jgi:hypothetical protein
LLTDFLSLENPILEEVKVTEIDWKEGKNVCRKVVTNKKAKKGKPKKKNVECKSFFRFFSKPLSNEDVYSKEDEEEDFGDRMDMTEDEDFTIAQIFLATSCSSPSILSRNDDKLTSTLVVPFALVTLRTGPWELLAGVDAAAAVAVFADIWLCLPECAGATCLFTDCAGAVGLVSIPNLSNLSNILGASADPDRNALLPVCHMRSQDTLHDYTTNVRHIPYFAWSEYSEVTFLHDAVPAVGQTTSLLQGYLLASLR